MDDDNGDEFINHDIVTWVAGCGICFTLPRLYRKNNKQPSSRKITTLCAKSLLLTLRYTQRNHAAPPTLAPGALANELSHSNEQNRRLDHRSRRDPLDAPRAPLGRLPDRHQGLILGKPANLSKQAFTQGTARTF